MAIPDEVLAAFNIHDWRLDDDRARHWLEAGRAEHFDALQPLAIGERRYRGMILVVEGCMAVGPVVDGKPLCDVPYPAGYVFGTWNFRDRLNRPPVSGLGYGHVTPVCEASVWIVPVEHHDACIEDPDIRMHFVTRIEGELALAKNLLSTHVSQATEVKVARYLHLLAIYTGRRQDGAVEVPVPREGFCQLVSLSRETVNRILGAWRADGIVETAPGCIRILDEPAFCRNVNFGIPIEKISLKAN